MTNIIIIQTFKKFIEITVNKGVVSCYTEEELRRFRNLSWKSSFTFSSSDINKVNNVLSGIDSEFIKYEDNKRGAEWITFTNNNEEINIVVNRRKLNNKQIDIFLKNLM